MKKIIFPLVVILFLGLNHQGITQNMALSVDGIDDYLEVFDSPSMDLIGPLTICIWYYLEPLTVTEPGLVQKDGPGSWGRYGIWLWEVDQVDFCLFSVSGYQQCLTTPFALVAQTWNHIAAVYDGIMMEVFVNGVSRGTQQFSSSISTSDLSLFIGGDVSETRYIKGYIDELSIWNVARTQFQIQQTMYDTLSSAYYSAPDSGLVAYYRFDQFEDLGIRGDGIDDIRDFCINANHGDSEGSPQLVTSTALTTIENTFSIYPENFSLSQNYPNPFNPSTTISYQLPEGINVTLKIFNTLGEEVATLVNNEYQNAGEHSSLFIVNSSLFIVNSSLPSGVYFYQLKAGEYIQTKKMILLK